MQEAVLPYKTWQQMPLISKSSSNSASSSSPSPSPSSSVFFHHQGDGVKGGSGGRDFMKKMVKENPVIVFGKRGCCMSHVVKRLLQALGVNPSVYEVDEKDENEVIIELQEILSIGSPRVGKEGGSGSGGSGGGGDPALQFPAVFIGGQLFGGLDRIMAAHITGELTPVLKKAGALWL